MFLRWKEGNNQQVTIEYDGPADLAAATTCIKCMYYQRLPPSEELSAINSSPVVALVQVLTWADAWQASGCITHCLRGMTEADIRPKNPNDVNVILCDLPDSVKSHDLFSKVKGVCLAWLLEHFADMYSVITEEAKRKDFSILCPAALELWMASDELAGIEDDVLVLLTTWHDGEQGQKAGAEDLALLSSLLRVQNLRKSNRCINLVHLPWFADKELLPIFNYSVEEEEAEVDAGSIFEHTGSLFPSAWTGREREGVPATGAARSEFVWDVPEGEYTSALTREAESGLLTELCSPPFYCRGAFFMAKLKFEDGQLGFYLQPAANSAHPKARLTKVVWDLECRRPEHEILRRQPTRGYIVRGRKAWLLGGAEGGDGVQPLAYDAERILWVRDGSRLAQFPYLSNFTFYITIRSVQ
ncbi:hypothetical protein DUNSADRAFT_387 [Dunaliella salina]|nr:hypothetical protein DUNSADRAFT_387 [Dunaliella salina]|eukprot:KAF5839610.1 hypothetical protein DUNSADRAFT_387 [Dunaliella salina]